MEHNSSKKLKKKPQNMSHLYTIMTKNTKEAQTLRKVKDKMPTKQTHKRMRF